MKASAIGLGEGDWELENGAPQFPFGGHGGNHFADSME